MDKNVLELAVAIRIDGNRRVNARLWVDDEDAQAGQVLLGQPKVGKAQHLPWLERDLPANDSILCHFVAEDENLADFLRALVGSLARDHNWSDRWRIWRRRDNGADRKGVNQWWRLARGWGIRRRNRNS